MVSNLKLTHMEAKINMEVLVELAHDHAVSKSLKILQVLNITYILESIFEYNIDRLIDYKTKSLMNSHSFHDFNLKFSTMKDSLINSIPGTVQCTPIWQLATEIPGKGWLKKH